MVALAGAIMIVVGWAVASLPLAAVGVLCVLNDIFFAKTEHETGCGAGCGGLLVALAVGAVALATVMYYGARL
jgi:hypothetical protein